MLINTGSYSNREICQTLEISELSVRRIKKKINLGEELCFQRTNKCGRKPIFTPRSERCLKKISLENCFTTTKQIKLNLKSKDILASERTVRGNLWKIYFKAHRPARKPCYGCKKSGMGKGSQGSRRGLLEIGKYHLINSPALFNNHLWLFVLSPLIVCFISDLF